MKGSLFRRGLQPFAGAVLLALLAAPSAALTHYAVDLSESATGWLNVTVDTVCRPGPCEFTLPVWNATYQVRDFAQYIPRLNAAGEQGAVLRVSKTAPHSWRVGAPGGSKVRVRYRALVNRPGPFGAYADARQTTLNLGQVLVYPAAERQKPFSLEFTSVPEGFKTAIELPGSNGRFEAPSYDRLIDTPVHLSEFRETEFAVDGKRIRLAVSGAASPAQLELLASTAGRIVRAARDLMGGLPFDSYTFVYVFSEEDGGAMEYLNGSIIFGPAGCPSCAMTELTAHEFFHLWNVKRIRPASMEPVDFTRPQPSPSLWFAEGVTSAYAHFLQVMAGLASPEDLIPLLQRLINDYESRPASLTQSAEESSIDAWLERYPAYGRPDRSVSYYLKGELIGYLLDLVIRHRSENRSSLDDVIRRLNDEYAKRGRFFGDTDDLERIASEIAGADLSDVFEQLVRTPAPIDWNEYLDYAGYRVEVSERTRPGAGMTLANVAGEGVLVSSLDPGGPAERGGIRVGDRIVRIGGRRVTSGAPEALRRIERHAGRAVLVGLERRGVLMEAHVEAGERMEKVFRIAGRDDLSPLQRSIRNSWMSRTPDKRAAAPPTE